MHTHQVSQKHKVARSKMADCFRKGVALESIRTFLSGWVFHGDTLLKKRAILGSDTEVFETPKSGAVTTNEIAVPWSMRPRTK